MTLKERCIRFKNAFHYKMGLRMPYNKWRIRALRRMGYAVGKDVYLPSDLKIALNFVYNRGRLTIGNRVSIASGVIIILSSHSNFSAVSKQCSQRGDFVTIEDDAWIGAGSIIMNGVTIGQGAVVGCGSIVTHDVAPHTVVAGNPAKVIRTITTNEHIG